MLFVTSPVLKFVYSPLQLSDVGFYTQKVSCYLLPLNIRHQMESGIL
uniref:Uncharacterized protein n=1 Tax=Arundo donax TaxID=35708 RepID=A0A0A9E1G2_ARUDO